MVEYGDITLTAGKQKKRGSLSWSSPSPSSMDFRSKASTKPVSIRLSDIVSLRWCRHFDGFSLRVGLQPGTVVKFSGFAEQAYKDIAALAKTRGLDVVIDTVSTKGTNAGQMETIDSSLVFQVNGLTCFELPLHLIAQAVAQSRNEVALELHHDENAAQQIESLVEMRIHIPDEPKQRPEGVDEDAATVDDDEDADERETPAQLFARELQLRGDIGATTSTCVASFEKLLFSVPRGKYDVELYQAFLKLASATYTYKIAYRNINKMFLFDLVDAAQHLFVIGLNPPVRQGRTAYPYLVVQFDSSEYMDVSFPAIDERTADELYGGLMKPSMKGPSHDVVTRVFKALTKKKVLIPGRSFVSSRSGASIQCSYKANEGHLFFLEKSFFFLKKPPMHIRHAAIASVEFDRMSSANKRFGMKFTLQDSSRQSELAFTNISRDEFDRIYTFLQDKAIHCITNGEESGPPGADGVGGGRRARAAASAGGDDYADDPYMKRLKADAEEEDADEGGEGTAESRKHVGPGEDSDSENDEDFTVDSDDDSGSSAASDDEELESEVDEDEDDKGDESRGGGGKRKKKPAKPAKKAAKRAAARDGSDEDDGDDEDDGAGKRRTARKVGGVTGYSLYAKATRPLLMISNPQASFGDISRLIGEQWKNETADVKNDWKRKAKEATPAAAARASVEEEKTAAPATARGVKRKKPSDSEQQHEHKEGEPGEDQDGHAADHMDLTGDDAPREQMDDKD